MKTKIFTALLLIAILLPFETFAQDDKNEWYPFVIPEKLDQDSPANIGKLVLDAPAIFYCSLIRYTVSA